MLEYAREAVEILGDREQAALESDRMLFYALVHLVGLVGEAANRVGKDEQLAHPEVPWSDIIGARNRLIHGYDNIDVAVLWQILHTDLPSLIVKLEAIPGMETPSADQKK